MKINWDKHGIDTNQVRGGKMPCPKCSHTRKPENRKDKCLSVDKDKGLFNCHNCGWSGTAIEDDYLERQREKREYAKPLPKLQKVSDPILKYFESRAITNNTLLYMKITEAMEWMPKANTYVKVICFNYFRKEELINIKFRPRDKDFRMEKGAELIFYNLDCVTPDRKLIVITEGEIDCLSFIEAGVYGVISVPNGASKGNARLEYVDNCFEELKPVASFLLATDNDEAGECLKQELIRRLGRERCLIPTYPEGCKDANEILLKYGKAGVVSFMKTARPLPLDGVLELVDIKDEAEKLYLYGYPETLKLGWKLDDYVKWRQGEFTVITGIPNHGKSTWLNNVLVELAKLHDWIIGIYSPEKNPITFLVAELAQIYAGMAYFRADPAQKMSRQQWEDAMKFIDDHFLFIKTDEDLTLDGFMEIGEKMVRRYGINGIVGDPWNYFEHDRPVFQSETEYIGIQLGKCSKWVKRTNVHMWVVAHPTKMEKDRKSHKYLVPGLYNISGSAHWNNKVDNGICIYRNYDANITEVHIQKIRWFFVGKVGCTDMTFEPASQRFMDALPALSPEQASYEEKKANKMIADRGREIVFPEAPKPTPATQSDLPF